MNINHSPTVINENLSQQMLEPVQSKQAYDLPSAKTLEFTKPTASTLADTNMPFSNTATSSILQNIFQNVQGLLSQLATQPQESTDYSESLKAFDSSNMTMPRSTVQSLRVTQGDARVEDEDSGHELENGGRTEVFTVQQGEPKRIGPNPLRPGDDLNALRAAGNAILDPRVESHYGERINSNGVDDYQFTGQYNITRAKETTIFQMLNTENGADDVRRPVLFLEAYTYEDENGDKRVRITDGAAEPTTREELDNVIETARRRLDNTTVQSERTELRNTINEARDEINRRNHPEFGFSEFPVAYDGPTTFDLEVNTNGRRAGIRIKPANDENAATQSYSTTFDRDRSTANIDRGDFSSIRYGAYHHDGDGTEPIQSTARLRVTDANLSRNVA